MPPPPPPPSSFPSSPNQTTMMKSPKITNNDFQLSSLYLSNSSKELLNSCFNSLLDSTNPSIIHDSLLYLRDKLLGNPILRRNLINSPLLKVIHNSLLNSQDDPITLQYCCAIITSLAKDPLFFVPLIENGIPSLLLQRIPPPSPSPSPSPSSLYLIHIFRALRSIFIHVPTVKEFILEPPLTTNLLTSIISLEEGSTGPDSPLILEFIFVIFAGFLPLQCIDSSSNATLSVAKFFINSAIMMEKSFSFLMFPITTEITIAVLDFLAGLTTSPASKPLFLPMILGLRMGNPLIRVKDALFSLLSKFEGGGEGIIFTSVILIHLLSSIDSYASGSSNGSASDSSSDVRMISIWLPIIIRIISNDSENLSLCGRAAALLGIACGASVTPPNAMMEELQVKAINNENLLKSLIGIISKNSSPSLPPLKGRDIALEGCLLCIASLSSQKEEHRRLVMEFGNNISASDDASDDDNAIVTRTKNPLLGSLVQCLNYRNYYGNIESFSIVRAAACQCVRSLSRSVKALRTGLVDAGVVDSLLSLVSSPSSSSLLKRTSCAALCNLVLDFSPMKEKVLKLGGVEVLVALVDDASIDGELAFNALWALKNLLYLADSKIKMASLALIGRERIESILLRGNFCSTPKWTLGCQEQCLNLLRNLICEKESDITEVIAVFGRENLLTILEGRVRNPGSGEALQHSLYIIANACTNNAREEGSSFKDLVMNSNLILPAILQLLNAFNGGGNSLIPWTGSHLVDLQLASLWCLINLSWPAPPPTSNSIIEDPSPAQIQQRRIFALKEMGFEDCLQNLIISISDEISLSSSSTYNPQQLSDLRDRVQTCIRNFSHYTNATILTSTPDLQNMMMVDANSTSSLE